MHISAYCQIMWVSFLLFFSFWPWVRFKNFPVHLLDFVLSTRSTQLHPHPACLEMVFAGKVNVSSSNAWDLINQSPRNYLVKKISPQFRHCSLKCYTKWIVLFRLINTQLLEASPTLFLCLKSAVR